MPTEPSPPTVSAVLAQAAARLQPLNSAALDAQLMLGHVLGRSRSELLAHGEELIPEKKLSHFERALERRLEGEPLAYIIGRREFWSLDLQVSAAVLVPRPETELVVERCLALVGDRDIAMADL